MGWGVIERAAYGFNHPVCVSENVIVPEPQDPEALGLQPSRTGLVILGLESMMAAVEFDDQFRRETNEVGDERTDGRLTAKSKAVDLLAAQAVPETALGVGKIFSQMPGVSRCHSIIL